MDFPHNIKLRVNILRATKNRVDPSMNRFSFGVCYKNQVDFYKIQKSNRFLLKRYKNQISFFMVVTKAKMITESIFAKTKSIFSKQATKTESILASSKLVFREKSTHQKA